ncbi:uncharacterized protein MELLADRAFT_52431 [Melampsora larici-populina 98AG31]|uniref:Uncharacterized protein n=1 Tax=Melampsora larici-populina (strain 98AG31 / pathotype 3-4-7) TaxID=747676 RepID=F4RJU5_MELLP|nr:uncharacterized protein MELLADRAFT_52431 [Melampsora larici-populina 98AG31]EGG07375.1 hypothetical protein MELLADRAFT_52431 [Melampsora larici-populina 98AG31]
MTPRPNQSVTHHMSPIDQAPYQSCLGQVTSMESFGSPSQSPVMSDTERKKRDKHCQHLQMTYKDSYAMDQQPQPNSLFEKIKGPSGQLDEPIQLD